MLYKTNRIINKVRMKKVLIAGASHITQSIVYYLTGLFFFAVNSKNEFHTPEVRPQCQSQYKLTDKTNQNLTNKPVFLNPGLQINNYLLT